MDFPDRLCLPFSFDPALLQADLARVEAQAWQRHTAHNNYEGRWEVLALRAAAGETHPIRIAIAPFGATEFVDRPELALCPTIRAVLARFACPLRMVRLMRLAAGSTIKEHEDLDLGIEDGQARIHIPITTNPDVDFRLNGRRIVMEPGSAWYLRLSDPHAVENRGAADRVHLVVDMFANDWLLGVFRQALQATPA